MGSSEQAPKNKPRNSYYYLSHYKMERYSPSCHRVLRLYHAMANEVANTVPIGNEQREAMIKLLESRDNVIRYLQDREDE